MGEPPPHKGAIPVHGILFGISVAKPVPAAAIKRPEFSKPIKKILPSSKLKSSIASIS
jgi:hypothetical protein